MLEDAIKYDQAELVAVSRGTYMTIFKFMQVSKPRPMF